MILNCYTNMKSISEGQPTCVDNNVLLRQHSVTQTVTTIVSADS